MRQIDLECYSDRSIAHIELGLLCWMRLHGDVRDVYLIQSARWNLPAQRASGQINHLYEVYC